MASTFKELMTHYRKVYPEKTEPELKSFVEEYIKERDEKLKKRMSKFTTCAGDFIISDKNGNSIWPNENREG